jgi:hypothetical protein
LVINAANVSSMGGSCLIPNCVDQSWFHAHRSEIVWPHMMVFRSHQCPVSIMPTAELHYPCADITAADSSPTMTRLSSNQFGLWGDEEQKHELHRHIASATHMYGGASPIKFLEAPLEKLSVRMVGALRGPRLEECLVQQGQLKEGWLVGQSMCMREERVVSRAWACKLG